MRAVWVALALLALTCRAVRGQPDGLGTGATLGIYDDPALRATFGTMVSGPKHVYVGIRYFPGWDGLVGVEFGISGLEPFSWSAQFPNDPVVVYGTLAAPADTLHGSGGINIAWSSCLMGDRALVDVTLWAAVAPQDHVLKITRIFPPWNPDMAFPYYFTCEACAFCWAHVVAGSYVLNPDIAVDSRPWAAIKRLYAGR